MTAFPWNRLALVALLSGTAGLWWLPGLWRGFRGRQHGFAITPFHLYLHCNGLLFILLSPTIRPPEGTSTHQKTLQHMSNEWTQKVCLGGGGESSMCHSFIILSFMKETQVAWSAFLQKCNWATVWDEGAACADLRSVLTRLGVPPGERTDTVLWVSWALALKKNVISCFRPICGLKDTESGCRYPLI